MKTTIDALVDALDGLLSNGGDYTALRDNARAAIAKARAEKAEQPPIGWLVRNSSGKLDLLTDLQIASSLESFERLSPLYTTAPAAPVAKLEPLTLAEIEELWKNSAKPMRNPYTAYINGVVDAEAAHNAKLSK